jgi:hypothetical protein
MNTLLEKIKFYGVVPGVVIENPDEEIEAVKFFSAK